tara:strand:- start:188 stop:1132 length:945 start_codon:yes stop_codon:yes gene_type:complete
MATGTLVVYDKRRTKMCGAQMRKVVRDMSPTKTKAAAAFLRTVNTLTATLAALNKARATVVAKVAAIPWHAALIVATGCTTGDIVADAVNRVTGEALTRPRIKLANGKPVASLFPGLDSQTDFNAGGLVGACGIRANHKAAKAAKNADDWQTVAATYGLTKADDCQTAAPAMRTWYVTTAVRGGFQHNVTTLRAAVGEALTAKADDDADKAAGKAADDAAKTAAKAAADKAAAADKRVSPFQRLADSLTRTKYRAAVIQHVRDDETGARVMRHEYSEALAKVDAERASAKAAAERLATKAEAAKAAKAAKKAAA